VELPARSRRGFERQARPETGRWVRHKREAQAALNEALTGVQRGTYIAPSRQTLGDFLNIWVEGVRTEVQITAWISYKQTVEQYVIRTSGRSDWSSCHRCTSSRGTRCCSITEAKTVAAVVAHGAALPSRPPSRDGRCRSMEPHRVQPADRRTRSAIEQSRNAGVDRRAIRRLPHRRRRRTAHRAVDLAMHTGMRRGELAGLRWKDLDLPGSTLTLRSNARQPTTRFVAIKPKARANDSSSSPTRRSPC